MLLCLCFWYICLWKTLWRFLSELRIKLLYDWAITNLPPGQKSIPLKGYVHIYVIVALSTKLRYEINSDAQGQVDALCKYNDRILWILWSCKERSNHTFSAIWFKLEDHSVLLIQFYFDTKVYKMRRVMWVPDMPVLLKLVCFEEEDHSRKFFNTQPFFFVLTQRILWLKISYFILYFWNIVLKSLYRISSVPLFVFTWKLKPRTFNCKVKNLKKKKKMYVLKSIKNLATGKVGFA